MYRVRHGTVEVLLVHPGGPFWAGKDEGVWSIPKGEFTDEDPLAVARREFQEETGYPPPPGVLIITESFCSRDNTSRCVSLLISPEDVLNRFSPLSPGSPPFTP